MDGPRYTIGEFAQRSGLTPRALRLYDDRGLLRPDAVDDATGYRSYTHDQLPRARRISALRSADVPLDVVTAIVEADAADAHVLLDRWWAGVRAEHRSVAALLPRLHELLDDHDDATAGVHDPEPRRSPVTDDATTAATAIDPARWQAALRAVLRGDLETLDLHLRDAPALADHRGPEGRTLLSEAARAATHDHALPSREAGGAHEEVVRRLLELTSDPSAPDDDGWTPLHSAGLSGHAPLARMLLEAGARTDAAAHGCRGATPLAYALFYGHVDAAEVIAAGGPDPDDVRTAAALGDLARLRRWLEGAPPLPDGAAAGMDFFGPPEWFPPRERPVDDRTVLDEALTWAARSGRIETMAALVEAGADVNGRPYRGTPLLWSVYADRAEATAWLLDHGADPDLRHDFGGRDHGVQAVALHLAAQYGSLRCLRLLLDRGADATIADGAHASTPLGWARFGEQPEAAAILEAHLGE